MARKNIDRQALRQQIQELDIDNELKSQLLDAISEQKKYGLVWENHKEDAEELLREKIPVLKEEAPLRLSPGGESAPNHILIEGDNLHALTALTYTHEGKVDVIYIDPPYNTGNKDFVYNDSFVDSEDGYRHSKWLSFMEKRLRIAKKLLSDRGVIFISIDDREEAGLKLLCDYIFSEDCFISNIAWQRTYSIRNDSKGIPVEVEHILVYSKLSDWQPNQLPRTEEMNSAYKNPDGDVGLWMSGSPVAPGAVTHQGMVYAIQHPFTGKMLYPSDKACWRYQQEQMLDYMNGWCEYKLEDINDAEQRAHVCGISAREVRQGVKAIVLANDLECSSQQAHKVYENGPWPRFYFTNKGKGGIRRKVYLDNVGGRITTNYYPFDEVGHTDEAKKELVKIFGKAPFDTPKPTRLIQRIEKISTAKDSLILDFFAGSGTTLHATMQLNAEDGGKRQCILVTNNENNICRDVTYERNKRVINGYTTPKGVEVEGLKDNNLRYYKVDFVERENTSANRMRLMQLSTDLLCIKENIYNEVQFTIDGKKMKKDFVRYFAEGDNRMLVVYDPRAISYIVDELRNREVEGVLKVYVYSDGQYAYNDEFRGLNVELCALPDAIYQALNRVLPAPLLSPLGDDEIPSGDIIMTDNETIKNTSPRGDQEGTL